MSPVTDTPWHGDACSLVDAFRAGERSPVEELDATLAAIEATDLNCFSHLDPERARRAAADADLSLPFGGVPTGDEGARVGRRLARHRGVARVPRPDRHRAPATTSSACSTRGGVTPVGLTTASEFGGLNVSVTKLNGVCPQPVAPRAHRRRVVGRVGLGRRRRPRQPGHRRRRRRVDPHPRRLHRPARHEGHLRAHHPRPARHVPPEHGGARQPGPLGARRGPLLRRVRRPRRLRPHLAARHPALRDRARHPRPLGSAGSPSCRTSAA